MVMQKRTNAHFQEMTENDDSAPYAVQGDREINRRNPTPFYPILTPMDLIPKRQKVAD